MPRPEERATYGDLAKSWLRAKWKQGIAGTQPKQDYADGQVAGAEYAIKYRMDEDLAFAALPGLKRVRDRKEAEAWDQYHAEQAAIVALPQATVRITFAGPWANGGFAGPLGVVSQVRGADLSFEIRIPDEGVPQIGDKDLIDVSFLVPDYHGDGHYDLDAIGAAAAAAGHELDYDGWTAHLVDDETPFAWLPEIGHGSIDVRDGGTGFHVELRMNHPMGDHDVVIDVEGVPTPSS